MFIDRFNSSVTHDIAKNRHNYSVYRRLGNNKIYDTISVVFLDVHLLHMKIFCLIPLIHFTDSNYPVLSLLFQLTDTADNSGLADKVIRPSFKAVCQNKVSFLKGGLALLIAFKLIHQLEIVFITQPSIYGVIDYFLLCDESLYYSTGQ